jgi:hypothetical protein
MSAGHIGRIEALCRDAPDWELECSHTDAGDPEQQKSVRSATIAKAVDLAIAEIAPEIVSPRPASQQGR